MSVYVSICACVCQKDLADHYNDMILLYIETSHRSWERFIYLYFKGEYNTPNLEKTNLSNFLKLYL